MLKPEARGPRSPPPDQEEVTLETHAGVHDGAACRELTDTGRAEGRREPVPGMSVLREKQETPCRRASCPNRAQRRLHSRRADGRCPAVSCGTRSDPPNPWELHLRTEDRNGHLTWLLGGGRVRRRRFRGKRALGVVPGTHYDPGPDPCGTRSPADTRPISRRGLRATGGI